MARGCSSGGRSGRGRSGSGRRRGASVPGARPGLVHAGAAPRWARARRRGGRELAYCLRPGPPASSPRGSEAPRGPRPAGRRSAAPPPRAAGPAGFPPYFPVLRICSRIPWRSQPISRPLGSGAVLGILNRPARLRGRGRRGLRKRGPAESLARGCVGQVGVDGGGAGRRRELPWESWGGCAGVAMCVRSRTPLWELAWSMYVLACESFQGPLCPWACLSGCVW